MTDNNGNGNGGIPEGYSIREVPVRTYRMHIICTCKNGSVQFTGAAIQDVTGPLFSHKCHECGAIVWLKAKFPLNMQEELEDVIKK